MILMSEVEADKGPSQLYDGLKTAFKWMERPPECVRPHATCQTVKRMRDLAARKRIKAVK